MYATHEKEKKKSCDQRIVEAENGPFVPLVLVCTGGMLRECESFTAA